jgi:hypothetical protein
MYRKSRPERHPILSGAGILATRTRDILNLLLQVAADRQVVVFTQQEQAAAWARENLTDPRHAIRELKPVAVA